MEIPAELLGAFSLTYQTIKHIAVDLVMECHDPDYETTMVNVRQRISKLEEEMFQLQLFGNEDIHAETIA